MTLLKHHYGNNLLARGDNFLNLGSDESDLDLMAAEYFTKLRNEDLPQVKIERHEALSKLWQKAKLCSKIPFRPVYIVTMKYAVKKNQLTLLDMIMKKRLHP